MTPARFASGHSLPSAENLFVVSPWSPAPTYALARRRH